MRCRESSPYPKEFRRQAISLAKLGVKPQRQLAKEMGISDVTLRNWLKQGKAEEQARHEAEAQARREAQERARGEPRGREGIEPRSSYR